MLEDQAPKCLCGTKQWNLEAVTFYPGLQSQWFSCNVCQRPALDIRSDGGHAFIISTVANGDFPQEGLQWVNSTLLLVWRDALERLTTARNVIEKEACDAFCENEGLAPGTKISGMNEGQTERFRAMWDILYKDDRWRKPAGFENQGLPPMVPQCITIFHPLNDGEWLRIDTPKRLTSRFLLIQFVFVTTPTSTRCSQRSKTSSARSTGRRLRTSIVVLKINPGTSSQSGKWFLRSARGKRVIAVKITAPEGINTDAIRNVAQADETTYAADGRWQSDATTATAIEVHAWTKEKLIEYLIILGRESATTKI